MYQRFIQRIQILAVCFTLTMGVIKMAYNTAIPNINDDLSLDCPLITANFVSINNALVKDHYPFNTLDEGKHIFNQAAAPTVATNAQVGIYCAALGGSPELYINKIGAQTPFTKAVKADPGYTYLPSGMILQWGTFTIVAYDSAAIVFPKVFSTICYSLQITAGGNFGGLTQGDATAIYKNLTVNGFIAGRKDNNAAVTFSYLAIGY